MDSPIFEIYKAPMEMPHAIALRILVSMLVCLAVPHIWQFLRRVFSCKRKGRQLDTPSDTGAKSSSTGLCTANGTAQVSARHLRRRPCSPQQIAWPSSGLRSDDGPISDRPPGT